MKVPSAFDIMAGESVGSPRFRKILEAPRWPSGLRKGTRKMAMAPDKPDHRAPHPEQEMLPREPRKGQCWWERGQNQSS